MKAELVTDFRGPRAQRSNVPPTTQRKYTFMNPLVTDYLPILDQK